jgi:PAS domain S-box-containing protein
MTEAAPTPDAPDRRAAAVAALWAAGDEAALVGAAARALGGPSDAVRVRSVDRDGRPVESAEVGEWDEGRARTLWRRGESAAASEHDLRGPDGTVVGTVSVQGAEPDALLLQQAGIALGVRRRSERLQRAADLARTERAELRVLRQSWRAAFGEAPIGMALTSVGEASAGRHLEVNDALCRLTGRTEAQLLAVSSLDLIHPDDRAPIASAYRRVVGGRRIPFSHVVRYVVDGRELAVRVTTTPVFDDDGAPVHAVVHVEDAQHVPPPDEDVDAASGLLGETALTDRLGETLARGRRNDTATAVLLLDVAELARPGADADATATEVGHALGSVLRPEDTLARVGGTTLAVVLEELSADNARMVTERFRNRLRSVPGLPAGEATVGIAMVEPGSGTSDEVLDRARTALRQAGMAQPGARVVLSPGPPAEREDSKVVLWSRGS